MSHVQEYILFIVGSFQTVFPFVPCSWRLCECRKSWLDRCQNRLSLSWSLYYFAIGISLSFLRFLFPLPMIETCRSLDDLSRNARTSTTDVEKATSAVNWTSTLLVVFFFLSFDKFNRDDRWRLGSQLVTSSSPASQKRIRRNLETVLIDSPDLSPWVSSKGWKKERDGSRSRENVSQRDDLPVKEPSRRTEAIALREIRISKRVLH